MALLLVTGADGREHLVHSSIFDAAPLPPRSTGRWSDVWKRLGDHHAMPDDTSNLDVLNTTAQGKLKSLVERIERLEEDKAAVANDLAEVFAEAKGEGFDTKILRKVISLRKKDKARLQEEEALVELYVSAIGGL